MNFRLNPQPLILCGLLASSFTLADDTEIYLSTGLDILDDAAKPNVMFLMDTSGSMGSYIAVEVPSEDTGFAYDPAVDYGDSNDDLIYVYNTDYEFQNITLTYEQSVCNDMETYFVDNPTFLIYSDRALQWQSSVTTETIEETELVCEEVDVGSSVVEIEENGRVDSNDWHYYGPYTVGAGTEFVATATTYSRDDRVHLYVREGSQPTGNRYDCRERDIRNASETCTISIGGSEEQIYVGVRGRNGTNNSDYDLEITYGGAGTVEVCEDVTTEVEVEITEANWSEALENTDDSGWVLECRGDRGDHGIDADSEDDYVRNCGSNDCTEPRYTSSRNSETNWNSVETRSFMTANYHDYVALFGAPEPGSGTLPTGNADNYCNDFDNRDQKFVDDGVTYQCTEKMDLMQTSANQLIASLSNMNLGLARLNGGSGGYVLEKIRDIDSEYSPGLTVKDKYTTTVNALPASGSTPLTESLWEMMKYLQGESPDFAPLANTDPDALSGGSYNSPIVNSCQSNNIILLTDGQPTSDNDRNNSISNLAGVGTCPVDGASSTSSAGSCLDELAEHMATHDMSTGVDGVSGTQTARVYTIGFDIDLPLLQTTANKGQGQYFTVSNAFELSSAFTSILVDILSDSSTFVAPAISVNAFNQLQHRDEIYFAVFRPNNSPRWTGNVKKFRIGSDGTIYDANNQPAIDPSTGYFADTAQDIWSNTVDGNNVDAGGFRDEMPDTRRVYTYFGDNPSNANLTGGSGAYQFTTSNDSITRELLGLEESATNTERNSLILWGAGEDIFDDDGDTLNSDANHFVGDALHSRPFLVTYGGTQENPYDILYVGTNMGYIHAIDGASGEELWSFIPDDLIKNIKYFQEGDASEPKVYGMDGEISLWVQESGADSDQDIEPADGDFVNLYAGMRRGGRDYYAFDVSNYNPSNLAGIYPILKWKINGGVDEFNDLGQSWSRMIKATVDWNCSGGNCDQRDVLFFSGGYDTKHDDATTLGSGDLGNAIYMIDAQSGELLWSVGSNSDTRGTHTHNLGLSDMAHSIPGSPNPVDVDADGIVDVMFAVDIAGNVFRFDMNDDTSSASNFATGGVIYELNEGTDFRRFYNQPDVVLTGDRGLEPYFNLVFGSGYMASPRDPDQNDAIFVLFEDDVFGPPEVEGGIYYDTVTISELYNPRGSGSDPADKYTNASDGYYIPLRGNGEKMLRPGLIFQDTVTYTSYVPDGNTNTDACSGGLIGGSRLYRIDLASGQNLLPPDDPGGEGEPGDPPDYIELVRPGIAPEGTIIFLEDGAVLCIATECSTAGDNRQVEKVYWREEEPNDDS
ncbi:MAG: PQQ-binding-like beta-propeller repeat protein [Porticoccaceae bacterium]|nr:PQQ-binding-like beta-propeller repeat protein [Porticoccaceae bacterium]